MTAENQNNNVYSPDTERDVDCQRVLLYMILSEKKIYFDRRFSLSCQVTLSTAKCTTVEFVGYAIVISTRKKPEAQNISCCFMLINSRFERKLVLCATVHGLDHFSSRF